MTKHFGDFYSYYFILLFFSRFQAGPPPSLPRFPLPSSSSPAAPARGRARQGGPRGSPFRPPGAWEPRAGWAPELGQPWGEAERGPRRAAPGPGRAPRRARGKFRRSRGAQSAAERCRCAGAMWPLKTPTWTPSFANLKDKVSTAPSGPAPLPPRPGRPPNFGAQRGEGGGTSGTVSSGARRRPCDLRGGRGVGDSQAVSPRVFIDRTTEGDEPSQPRCFPGGWGHRDPRESPGWEGAPGLAGRGSRPAGLGVRVNPRAVGLAACLLSTLRSRRPPSLVKCCHLPLFRVIPLYEFLGWFRVKCREKSVHVGERWGLRAAGWGRGGSTPTVWASQRGWVPPQC